ncbi:MAG: type II secretion system protein N [Pseudomonadota bacterium]
MKRSMANPVATLLRAPTSAMLWVRRVCLALVAMVAVYLAVRLILALAAPNSLWEPTLVAGPSQATTASARVYDFSYNPFEVGDDAVEPIIEATPGTDAPETTLNLTLVGQRSGENGTAFIRTPDNQDKNYYVDDEVMPGVVLEGVFPGYVLIRVNGQTQRLTMEDGASVSARGQSAPARSSLQTIRSADAQTFLSQARLTLFNDELGNRVGVQIEPRTPAFNLADYGLQQGDVITRFAGQNLQRGNLDITALRRVAASGRPIDVELIREGKPMTITIGTGS